MLLQQSYNNRLTYTWLGVMFFNVVSHILLILIQDFLAGHPWDDGQVRWGGLGYGGVASVQQELTIIDDPGSCTTMEMNHTVKHTCNATPRKCFPYLFKQCNNLFCISFAKKTDF